MRYGVCFAILGIAFHHSIRPFEIDYQILRLLSLFIVVCVVLVWTNYQYYDATVISAIRTVSAMGLCFNTGLATSMFVYRAFFHRLKTFPGPFVARVSKLYAFTLQWKSWQYFEDQVAMKRKYGDFVRTGPREITIFHPSALPLIYGSQSPCLKSAWYHQVSRLDNETSVNTSRDPASHRLRRRGWDRGFGVKGESIISLAQYEARVDSKADTLVTQLKSRGNNPINISQWSMFYSFDVMGLVGFSEDFKQLESGTEHYAVKGMHDQLFMLGLLNQIPWLSYPLNALQPFSGGFGLFKMYCSHMVTKSLLKFEKSKGETPQDVISWLLKAQAENDRSAPPTAKALDEDSNVLILAGSDTTGNTLACVLHYLATNPSVYKKLQTQLDEIFTNKNQPYSYAEVRKLPYLDAILKETMRLKPAVPSGNPRVTPAEGLQIGDVWIPGDVNVVVPQYAVHRDERVFPRAGEFLPERWLNSDNALSVDEQAYFPFQIGPRGCVGKEFAMMTMRIFLSRIALNFDIASAPGEDGVGFDTSAKDYLAISVGPLHLVFSDRANSV
ncbi:putative cytochrome P450 [Aspergillus sclerotiicarbonarius CBS 121057]|uniref:Putative cytochrome P450 n=1 Tax=Aspergillus sclerotiicarbonarius (strain CBS 121057 / IBT 28362) TaxID=1448318 RepID=A0A319EH68_ASPSB|nr:putative cytochrome P450 [Aspergillus sclerotiicarbonarius CBS 121057]